MFPCLFLDKAHLGITKVIRESGKPDFSFCYRRSTSFGCYSFLAKTSNDNKEKEIYSE